MNTQTYTVNIRTGVVNITRVDVSQGDTGRTLAFSLYDGLSSFTPPTGSTVTIVGRKPSKLGFSEACTVSGNVATVTTTLAMTQEAGKFPVELRIEANGESIGTANFTMYIEPSPHPDGTTDGTHATVDNLQTQIGNLANLTTTAKTNLVSAINEAAQSGSEVIIDDTLTQTGQAADAKATGDELSALKADLGEVTESTRNLNTSNVGRWGNAADGKIYSRDDTYYGMESFIPITAGQTYYVSFGGITSSSAISWTYLFVNDSGTNLERAGYSNIDGHAITAPSGATKLHIFCKSDNTITISDDAYIQIEKGSSATQHIPAISATDYLIRETADKAFQVYNVIDSSTDLDALPKNGAYRWNTSSVPQHSPVEKACRLVNIPSDANSGTGWIQIAITSDTVLYIRYRITANWSDWAELASKAYVDTRLSELLITDGDSWEA